MFEQMLNWKLLSGSHDFPGKDGGTCVNEAALVAAGFEYKSIVGADDMPPCFSRTLCDWALIINDTLPEGPRQDLIKFVTRLAGTADTPAVEQNRKTLINTRLGEGMERIWSRVDMADPNIQWPKILWELNKAISTGPKNNMQLWSETIIDLTTVPSRNYKLDLQTYINLHFKIREVVDEFAQLAMDTLEEAMKIGNRATPIEHVTVIRRMEEAKATA